MRTAVVGHVEWVEFARVPRVPRSGEIVHVDSSFFEPAGGGAVAAVQLSRLAGECVFYTALGEDDLAGVIVERLEQLGVRVEPVIRTGKPTRRALTYLEDSGERTITTLGERLHPGADDPLPWDDLEQARGVYFVAGDSGALRAARAAHSVVATARIVELLADAHVELDAVVGSARDPSERYRPIDPPPSFLVSTAGSSGGSWSSGAGTSGNWAAVDPPGPLVDFYGAGDSFAAGLTYALGSGYPIESALELAARCGATCATGRGPYERQLTAAEL